MKNEISSHHVTSRDNLAPKTIRGVPGLRAHQIFMTSWGHDTLAQTHANMTSICSSVSGSETSPTLLKFSRFSAQISGFSADFLADFHRKFLDIVKQHPHNAEIWADSVFLPSNQRQMGEHKFDGYRFGKNWELEDGKKSGFWRSKK